MLLELLELLGVLELCSLILPSMYVESIAASWPKT
jgi:hypothetical protein